VTNDLERDMGRLEANVETLQSDVCQLRKDVRAILETLAEARGGWKMLVITATIAGAVGALIGKLAAWVGWLPK